MGQKRRRLTREFKLEALRLVEGGRTTTEVAGELGIGAESIYRWKREIAADHQAFPGNGNLKERDKEVEELRREVTQLRAENTCLKKVSAFFAKAGRHQLSRGQRDRRIAIGAGYRCLAVWEWGSLEVLPIPINEGLGRVQAGGSRKTKGRTHARMRQ